MNKIIQTSVFISFSILSACQDTSLKPANNASQAAPAARPVVALSPLAQGKQTWARCKACHTLGEGEKTMIGPNLYNFMGQEAGTKKGFVYSKAMMSSGIVWSDETLSDYLANPLKYIPKNRMAFAGLRITKDRENLILYLRSETDPDFEMKPEYMQAPTTPEKPSLNIVE